MSEASSGRAAGGEIPTSSATWQCTNSDCHREMQGILPNSLPFCPFCRRPQEGFSHRVPGDVSASGPRSNSPPNVTTAQAVAEDAQHSKEPVSPDTSPIDASLLTHCETQPVSEMDGAGDHIDSPESENQGDNDGLTTSAPSTDGETAVLSPPKLTLSIPSKSPIGPFSPSPILHPSSGSPPQSVGTPQLKLEPTETNERSHRDDTQNPLSVNDHGSDSASIGPSVEDEIKLKGEHLARERGGPPVKEKDGLPAKEKSGAPAMEKAEPPVRKRDGSPDKKKDGPPAEEKGGPLAKEIDGPPAKDKARPPAKEKTGPPAKELVEPPAMEKAGPPAKEKAQLPPKEKGGPLTKEEVGPPDKETARLPVEETGGPLTKEKAGSPAKEKSGPPAKELACPPSKEKFGPPAKEKAGPPAKEKTGPPAKVIARPPAKEKAGPLAKENANKNDGGNVEGDKRSGANPKQEDQHRPPLQSGATATGADNSGGKRSTETAAAGEPPSSRTRSKSSGTSKDTPEQPYKKKKHGDQDELLAASQGRTSANSTRGSSESDVSGLNAPADQSFQVTFHAIVPNYLWGWSDKHQMFLVFGIQQLGNWKNHLGDFGTSNRCDENGLCHMQCTLQFPIQCLKDNQSIPYKYVIVFPEQKEKNDKYEYIHDIPGDYCGYYNRCLKIPNELLVPQGKYSVFDSIVCPRAKKSDTHGWLYRIFFGTKHEKDVHMITDHNMMQVQCLHIYLSKYQDLLDFTSSADRQMEVGSMMNFILEVYRQMYYPVFIHFKDLQEKNWAAPEVTKEIKMWLMNIALKLQQKETKLFNDNGRRITAATLLIMCFHNASPPLLLDDDERAQLLSLLEMKPNVESHCCRDFQYFKSLMDIFVLKEAKIAIRAMCIMLAQSGHLSKPQWLYAIPLIHFLDGACTPFQRVTVDPETFAVWEDKAISLTPTEWAIQNDRAAQDGKYKFVETYYERMELLFEADQLLLPIFVRICPKAELSILFTKIPFLLALSWLAKLIQKCQNLHQEVKLYCKLLQYIIEAVQVPVINDSPTSLKDVFSTSLLLLSSLKGKIHDTTDDSMIFLKKVIGLILIATNNLASCAENHSDKMLSDWGSLESHCVKRLSSFMELTTVEMFRSDSLSCYADKELKFWESLLQLDCPDSMKSTWHRVVRDIVESRINRLPDCRSRVHLLSKLNLKDDNHSLLVEVFMEAAMKGLEQMMKQDTKETANTVDSLMLSFSKRQVGELLSALIQTKYPNGASVVDFDELLQWDLWPSFIKFYASEGLKVRDSSQAQLSHLPDKSIRTCENAHCMLLDVCENVRSGKVTLAQLEKISKRKQHFINLCDAVSGRTQESMNIATLSSALDRRFAEYQAFHDYQEQLRTVCHYISIPVQGLSELKDALQHHFNSETICQLCKWTDEGLFSYFCFPSAVSLIPMLKPFFLLMHHYHTDIFKQIWSGSLDSAWHGKVMLVLTDIVPLVWQPFYCSCKQLLDSLINRRITLGTVEEYFSRYKSDQWSLVQAIEAFSHGMYTCLERTQCTEWIGIVAESIQQYWSLGKYSTAATALLQLKTSLHLTGNFSDVEQLAAKVNQSMFNQPLCAIDKSLMDTGNFLEVFITNDQKLHCLKTFCECLHIVEWLRNETEDVGDLHNFVSVALSTAAGGEGDLVNDQLSDLRTVGRGYGSLIYDLTPNAGFLEFKEHCKPLWDFLDHTSALPDLLNECNNKLDWYKAVKDTQGSVERSTFGQLDAIIACGWYCVGYSTFKVMKSIHEISVTLKEHGKGLHKKLYTLDELRDLESKLVLITGSRAENRKKVDLFVDTLQCICRIAEALIALQQAGAVEYIGWSIVIPCGENLLADLQLVAEGMEECLGAWNEEVILARQKFYELNYFTTVQLLMLRKELAQLKDPDYDMSRITVAFILLQSISAELDMDTVRSVMRRVCGQPSDIEQVFDDVFTKPYVGPSTFPTQKSMAATIMLASIDEDSSSDSISPAESTIGKCDKSTLNAKQVEIIALLTVRYDFSKKLVLKALQECGEDLPDCMNWCRDNDGSYSFSEDEEDSESEYEISSDEEQEELKDTPMFSEIREEVRMKSVSSKVKVIAKEIFDENHPEVRKLQEAEYSLDESIAAIEQYGTATAAVDYFISTETDDKEELDHLSRTYSRSYSDEHDILEEKYSSEIVIIKDTMATSRYISLQDLGRILRILSEQFSSSEIEFPRQFSSFLKCGQPNLIVSPPENVLKTVLAVYMEEESSPLPSCDEVLICNPLTTEEEVTLLWRRAIGDPGFKRIFCLVLAEKLSYQVCDRALRSLQDVTQGRDDYRVVIICSNKDEDKSHIVSKLEIHRKEFIIPNDDSYKAYLNRHFTISDDDAPFHQQGVSTNASAVDPDFSCVRVVSSQRSGMGKSLYIRRMSESLCSLTSSSNDCITIPVHGPRVTPDSIMALLKDHVANSTGTIFHIDVSPSVLYLMDTILFSLLVLRGLKDSSGYLWRSYTNQLYAVEVTISRKEAEMDMITTDEGRQENPGGSDTSVVRQSVFPLIFGSVMHPSIIYTLQQEQYCCLAFLDLLPTVECVTPVEALEDMAGGSKGNTKIVLDMDEFESDHYQRVYQYLRRYVADNNLDTFSYAGTVEQSPTECLDVLLKHCGVRDPSWSESIFCDEKLVGDVMSGLKSFVVNFMIAMAKDFATSSLCGEVARENREEADELGDQIVRYAIDLRKQWEQNPHPYIFFNHDRESITFVGFKVSPDGGVLVNDSNGEIIEVARMSQQLLAGLKHNQVNFAEDYRYSSNLEKIQKIATVLGLQYVFEPDPTYVLTADNLVKILAIHMRFRCNIPVVIMGETGCGKTRLIRFMCNLMAQKCVQKNLLILKVHGGTTEEKITNFVNRGIALAEENQKHNLDTVLFFDEANTTDAIGLIKEIMCDRRLQGCPLTTDIKFIAACNPYRKHSFDMISKLESAGLGFYHRISELHDKLGSIPLRQLVYRVLDLPPSMRPLVYDFGQLNPQTEQEYSNQIVRDYDYVSDVSLKHLDDDKAQCIASILAFSQQYMRERKDECSFVSLRDVKRAMIVFDYFLGKMDDFGPLMDDKAQDENKIEEEQYAVDLDSDEEFAMYAEDDEDSQSIDPVTRSLVLALGVCYHARLQEREDFEHLIAAQFVPPLRLPGREEQFRNEIRYCQEVLLDNMKIGMNIAKNAALRENIFMMAVCIELRIPLFLVGKPGSSKSLAKSIIADSMCGKRSQNALLKDFKEVDMLSFQCSQLSTPEGVIEVFTAAKRLQKDRDTSKYVSVVVLDEVGLAEDSPNLPLKALHPLLEDGTEPSDVDEIVDRDKRVAFIGISNWALDPAKMNRGIMVTRSDPDEEELELSARGICSFKDNDLVKERLEMYFRPLAAAYKRIYMEQTTNFFGLRDFYSLIKMLYWMCEQSGIPLTAPQLEHAIKRNFGGLEDKILNPLDIFRARIHATEPPDLSHIPLERHHIISPDCTKFGLIKTSLMTKEITWHGENRYLLFLTENYAALDILRHYLQGALSFTLSDGSSDGDTEPFILFGSSFPRDKEYTQVCRNINRIKICMETGRTVILLNLDNLYESLYDLLNQYYLYQGGHRYVDLGLQTLRVKCRVHANFKLILIAEKTTVYEKFPTPLINRMEKHFVLTSSILDTMQQHVLSSLKDWISSFSEVIIRNRKFNEEDAFIGYQKDTPAAAVFQATNQLEKLRQRHPGLVQMWSEVLESRCLGFTLDDITEEVTSDSDQYQHMVLAFSKYLLLQTAPEDALVRLQGTKLANSFNQQIDLYFKLHFSTISDFLKYHLNSTYQGSGQMFQVTTHSHLIPQDKIFELESNLGMQVYSCTLQQFDTELDFTNSISPSFKERGSTNQLLIIQCDSGHMSGDLIACARYLLLEERHNSIQRNKRDSSQPVLLPQQPCTHVLFIIHLPKREFGSSFVGFQGDPWMCTHIDNLLPPEDASHTLQLQDVLGHPLSELFYHSVDEVKNDSYEFTTRHLNGDETEQITVEVPQLEHRSMPKGKVQNFCFRLHGCIHSAVSHLEDIESHSPALSKSRAKQRVDILLRLIPKKQSGIIENTTFFKIVVTHIHRLLEEREHIFEHGANWILEEALDTKKLQSSGTFRNVLTRKLDEEMSRPFTEIIAFIDRHYNLDLLNQDRSEEHVIRLWLAIFELPTLLPFRFSDLITVQKVPGVGGRMSVSDFKCQFPFSWVVQQTFDDLWINAKTVDDNTKFNVWNQLCEEVKITYIGEVLTKVNECDSHSLYECYLHDFVRIVHNCHHKKTTYADLEYKLVCKSLHSLVSTMDGHLNMNLLQLIASLHVIYHMFESEVMLFGQLASCMPQILQKLDSTQCTNSEEMILHLCAVECALSSDTLKPPIEKEERIWNNWLALLRQSRIAIDTILSISAHHCQANKLWKKWQLTRVLQLFVEHILLKHEDVTAAQVRKLHLFMVDDSDFLKASAIVKVKRFLNSMITTSKKRKRKIIMELKNSCQAFFMEVISTLSFGGIDGPEPQLVRLLLDMVFIDGEDEQVTTQELTPYKGEQDSVPVIRSFILQLLLEHSSEQVREHLNEYFILSSRALSSKTIDTNVCLLIVKCFEDNIYREHATKALSERIELACRYLKRGGRTLTDHAVVSHEVTVDYLEGVSEVRFALILVADTLNNLVSGASEHSFTAQADNLLRLAETVCSDTTINEVEVSDTVDAIGPNVYLLKLLVRQFGSARLLEISKACNWVLPPQLKIEQTEVKTHVDPFVVYEQVYSDVRQALNDATYGNQFQHLKQAAEALTLQDAPMLLLALYEKVTLSRASALPSKQLLPEVLEDLDEVIQESRPLSNELKLAARALIANEQGGPLGQMQVTPTQSVHCRVLGRVVIHAATVFLYHNQMQFLLPFFNMLNSPSALSNAFLPTMPQDPLAEIRQEGESFYECPNGHIYFVGECGRPVEEKNCPVCGSYIGGAYPRLREDNKVARTEDTTQTGYALGNPEHRSRVPTPERKLSSASCCVVRALMHCVLIWASCNNEFAVQELCQLVKKRPLELPEFFWRHLEVDIELLGRAINKNAEQSALMLHLVLKNVLTYDNVPSDDVVQTIKDLASQDARETWEDIFDKTYIQPVLEKLDKSIGDAMDIILSDDHQEHDRLFYLVYERVSVSKDSLAPHLWTYRARITLEHLSQTLQQQSSKTKCPILLNFLKEEPSLRATQYLPDIIKLQQMLYDCFHHRLDRNDAARLTIGDFMQQRANELTRNEYRVLIHGFKCAWILIRDKLHDHGRLRVDEKYINKDINDATPMEYLIPTTTGPGACSMALADFLTLTHNDFIQRCRAITNEGTASNFMWDKCEVPITHLHRCHLLDYEHQLLSIILSHCHYSLTLGKGEDVSYDLPALEKHILDRFIHGKPTILADIPQVVYRQDVYNADTFAAIRAKVKPQERLSTQAQHEIVAELHSMEKLRDNLDVVEIVIGFLSSGGGRADKSLADYIRTLKISRKSFSKKAKEHCTLGHVLSLWELLSVHLAKRLQEPFDTLSIEYQADITLQQRQSLDHCLGSFDLSQLLGVLYEFLEVYVRHSPSANREWPLLETLLPFQAQYEIPSIAQFEDKFPSDITLAQAAAAWKYIVVYQARLQGGGEANVKTS